MTELNRVSITAAAVDVLAEHGLADLTMRRLARELGVAPAALYWHVANKQELLTLVAADLLGGIAPRDREEPLVALTRVADEVRATLLTVPDAADVVALAHAIAPEGIPALTCVERLLLDTGRSPEEAAALADVVVHHVLGSVTDHQNARRAALVDPDVSAPSPSAERRRFTRGLAHVLGTREPADCPSRVEAART